MRHSIDDILNLLFLTLPKDTPTSQQNRASPWAMVVGILRLRRACPTWGVLLCENRGKYGWKRAGNVRQMGGKILPRNEGGNPTVNLPGQAPSLQSFGDGGVVSRLGLEPRAIALLNWFYSRFAPGFTPDSGEFVTERGRTDAAGQRMSLSVHEEVVEDPS